MCAREKRKVVVVCVSEEGRKDGKGVCIREEWCV